MSCQCLIFLEAQCVATHILWALNMLDQAQSWHKGCEFTVGHSRTLTEGRKPGRSVPALLGGQNLKMETPPSMPSSFSQLNPSLVSHVQSNWEYK